MKKNQLLSVLWVFLLVNYLFCDVFSLFHSEHLKQLLTGELGGVAFTQQLLLSFAMLMEIPMLMIVLSFLLIIGIEYWASCSDDFSTSWKSSTGGK